MTSFILAQFLEPELKLTIASCRNLIFNGL